MPTVTAPILIRKTKKMSWLDRLFGGPDIAILALSLGIDSPSPSPSER